jgi:hypothetical protein
MVDEKAYRCIDGNSNSTFGILGRGHSGITNPIRAGWSGDLFQWHLQQQMCHEVDDDVSE